MSPIKLPIPTIYDYIAYQNRPFGSQIDNTSLSHIFRRMEEKRYKFTSTTHPKRGAKTKLRLTNYDCKESYRDVMFNPEQFGDSKPVNYGTLEAPMQSYPRHVYQGGGVTTLNGIELLYHHEDPYNVRKLVIWLQTFLPYAQDGASVRVPPTLLFSWGGWYTKRCILKSLNTDYTMFNEDLQPTECKITLDLEVVPVGTEPWTPQPWEVLR